MISFSRKFLEAGYALAGAGVEPQVQDSAKLT